MGYCILVLKCKYVLCFDFQDLGGRKSYNVDDFYDFLGVKNHGGMWLALSWLCRVGVSECELGFTAIDVSSGSLGRIHGEGRRE